jgi:hypothetical protein
MKRPAALQLFGTADSVHYPQGARHLVAVQHKHSEKEEPRLGWKEYLCVAIGSAIGYFLAVLT